MEGLLGERIRKIRKDRGLTQEELAELCSVVPPTVSRWEHGSLIPNSEHRIKIANALKIELNDLYDDVGQPVEMSLLIREIVGILQGMNKAEQEHILQYVISFEKFLQEHSR